MSDNKSYVNLKGKRKRRMYYDPCQEEVIDVIPCYEKKGAACRKKARRRLS